MLLFGLVYLGFTEKCCCVSRDYVEEEAYTSQCSCICWLIENHLAIIIYNKMIGMKYTRILTR